MNDLGPAYQPAQPPFVSYAQNFEDVMLWRALHDIAGGTYLDVGAGEPEADSVTLAFYERGWRGVNVEPLPGPFARLQSNRPNDINLNYAVGAAAGRVTFFVVGEETALSTANCLVARHHETKGWPVLERHVEVATLAEICALYVRDDLHFLKIDAEGAELDILKGADFVRFRPWIVLLEAPDAALGLPGHDRWEVEVLTPAGYHFVWFDGLNRFYVAAEHEARMAPAFRAPPNVFDRFVRKDEFGALMQAQQALVRVEAAETLLGDAQERALKSQAHVEALQVDLGNAQSRAATAEARADDSELQIAATQALLDGANASKLDLWQLLNAADEKVSGANEVLAAAEKYREEQTAHLVDLTLALDRVAKERDGWAQELYESNRHAAELVRDRQRLLEELDRQLRTQLELDRQLRTQLELRTAQTEALRGERDKARVATSHAEEWLRAVRLSTSWRVTRPIRVLLRLIGRR